PLYLRIARPWSNNWGPLQRFRAIGLLSLVLCIAAASPLFAKTNVQQEEQAVKQAADRFYSALNEMFRGDLTQMKEIWSHSDEGTYMGPTGGVKTGLKIVVTVGEAPGA